MSATAERLREPEQLFAPPHSKQRELQDVLDHLTPEGGKEFARQVIESLETSREEGDLRPLNMVIESWYRTWVFKSDKSFDDKWANAEKAVELETLLSIDDIRSRRTQRPS